jgi:uncharacterized cupredoxin-like copper-binding protein
MTMFRLSALAALPLLLASPAEAQAPSTYTVGLSSFAIAPNPIRLRAGQPVRLVFTNQAGRSHDFTAKRFFAQARILAGAAPGGQIELKGGQSATVDLVPAAGRYKAHCGHFMHKPMGMSADIIVE